MEKLRIKRRDTRKQRAKSVIYNALCDRSAYLFNAIEHIEELMEKAPSSTLHHKEQRLKAELIEERKLVNELANLFI